jgi:hypothetical protein
MNRLLSSCLSTGTSSRSTSNSLVITMRNQDAQQKQRQQQQLLLLASTEFDLFIPNCVFNEEEPPLHPPILSNVESSLSKKRPLEAASSTEPLAQRFKIHQSEQWAYMLGQLEQYRTTTGHCNVPHTHPDNPALARWVKRQRYQYKLMLQGKATSMTTKRVKVLESIGFCWDSQGAAWFKRFHDLKEYHSKHGDCNVPSNYQGHPSLASWVKCQRRQMKFLKQGEPSSMSPYRQQELVQLGFEWELRCSKKVGSC